MLSGPHDAAGAIVEVKSGAGGMEAMDWAAMLLPDVQPLLRAEGLGGGARRPGGRRGGRDQLGVLHRPRRARLRLPQGREGRAPPGAHQPLRPNARRQTSFAAVDVNPEIEDDIVIDIKEADVRIDTYRSSGAGGQKVNKTDSAVRTDPPAHRHRGGDAERAEPAEEPGHGLEDPPRHALRPRGAQARRGPRRGGGAEEGHRLRLADPQLRARSRTGW